MGSPRTAPVRRHGNLAGLPMRLISIAVLGPWAVQGSNLRVSLGVDQPLCR